MEILSINRQSYIYLHIYIYIYIHISLFSTFRKYTLLTLENISMAYLRITILPHLSDSNYKLTREQLPKYKPEG